MSPIDAATPTGPRDRLRLVLDALPVMVAGVDHDLRYTIVNSRYAARFGATPDALIGKPIGAVVGPEVVALIEPYVRRALAGERVTFEGIIPYPGIGPQTIRCELAPEHAADGGVAGCIGTVENVTERRRVQANERNFSFLVQQASDFIGISDLEFQPIYVNEAARRLVGLTDAADGEHVTVFDFIQPEHHQFLRETFFPAVLRDGRASAEIQFRHFQTGAAFWMQYNVLRLDDERGHPIGYATISRDLTEEKRTETLLLEVTRVRERSLARLRELADSLPQIVWSTGPEGIPDYYNRQWYRRAGTTTPDELNGSDLLHPADRDACVAAWAAARATGTLFEMEYRLKFPGDPEYRWYLGRTAPVRDESGAVVRWYGTSTDIHDQKMAETALGESRERLRAALDASETGTFRWDIRTNALDWDASLDRLFGVAPNAGARSLAEFIGLVHPDDRAGVVSACERCAAEGADFEEEFRVVWPDGTVRWLYDKGRAYADADGRPLYMTGACVDVTERRRKEDDLRDADRQKDEFLGMLAHELRNPLAPFVYGLAAIERLGGTAAIARPLEIMHRQVRRMTKLVDDLLDVSRVTQGKIPLHRETVDIVVLVQHALDASRPALERRGHAVDVVIEDADLRVSGDAQRLGQVFENLLGNAAKYTPPHGRITVSVRRDGGEVAIAIRDTGVGIAADMLPRVFDLFVQADASLERADGGLGIGLTLVDRLTRLHGGRVSATSDGAGHGTEFTVHLPLLDAEARSGTVRPQTSPPAVEPRRILIVDDNQDSAEMLAALLQLDGHAVRVVADGRSALTAAGAFDPDVVLLDIGLPGMNGFDVIREIRATPALRHLAVVATTGFGRDEDRARTREAGFDHHLTKPIDIADVRRLLATVGAGADTRPGPPRYARAQN